MTTVRAKLIEILEDCLRRYKLGEPDIGFGGEAIEVQKLIEADGGDESVDLDSAWNFADEFFDAYSEGQPTLDGTEWPAAEQQLQYVIECLKSDSPIEVQYIQHEWAKTGIIDVSKYTFIPWLRAYLSRRKARRRG